MPALPYTYIGLVNGDTSVVFRGSLATTATSSSSVGDYPITVGTLAATGNYTVGTYNPRTLTIAKADITVTPYDVTYDGNVHNATGTTLTGLVINSAHTNAGISGSIIGGGKRDGSDIIKLGGPADVRAIFTWARHFDFGPPFAGDPWDDRPTLGRVDNSWVILAVWVTAAGS